MDAKTEQIRRCRQCNHVVERLGTKGSGAAYADMPLHKAKRGRG